MTRNILSICLLCLSGLLSAQGVVHVYQDTLRAEELLEQVTEDDWLLSLIAEQSRQLAAKEDSLYQARMLTDTTTAFPFHVGFADSLRIAEQVARMSGVHPLAMPLYYVPRAYPSLRDSLPDKVDIYTVRDNARRYLTRNRADLYVGLYDSIEYETMHEIHADNLQHLIVPERSLIKDSQEDWEAQLRAIRDMRTPWRMEATTLLQITQNFVSKNWYAGGNSNFTILGIAQGSIVYDNKKNVTWENTGEWRMGFSATTGDTLRKINTNDDLFRLYSKLGVKAFGKFSYMLSGEFQTQFFRTWEENTMNLKTGPLTPIRFNLSVGLDYKPVEGLSIVFAPLTYKMVYTHDTTYVAATAFGVEEGKKLLNDVGSSLRVNWLWKPVREISLDSKLYFYTNYKRVEIDWDITCNFIINRYFSARLSLHPRYDNTVVLPNDEKARLQFKELLSIGFYHKFR